MLKTEQKRLEALINTFDKKKDKSIDMIKDYKKQLKEVKSLQKPKEKEVISDCLVEDSDDQTGSVNHHKNRKIKMNSSRTMNVESKMPVIREASRESESSENEDPIAENANNKASA